ncbi:MAG: serine/threonine protein kinase, partial [Cyanobacteria bacterium]|nr:serine/threonine protein kinase [Cyanobacteriota bacterium]
MNSHEDICATCRKPKTSTSGGLVTQMIEICLCNSQDPSTSQPDTKICRNCRKPIGSRNSGSFTQFVFSPGRCDCETPEPMEAPQSIASSHVFQGLLIEEDEPELQLDSSKFPTDRYRPLAELGSGASGRVILCRDRLLGKKVAIKTLHHLSPEELVSFQDEAKATNLLNHPNIVRILDFGITASGAPFLVMDYIAGESLEKQIRENGLTLSECIQVIVSIADALSYAHNHGIFHRDIKPSNVLLLTDETDKLQVRLIDFGIARVKEATGSVVYQGRTMAGTPAYMSPDTIRGFVYDERSEIYSLGCVLFEALEGHPPFRGETVLEVLYDHAEKSPPPITNSDASVRLKELVTSMLAKSPGDRPASMGAVSSALNSLSAGYEPSSKSVSVEVQDIPSKKRKNKAVVVISALLILGSITLLLMNERHVRDLVSIRGGSSKATPSLKGEQDYSEGQMVPLDERTDSQKRQLLRHVISKNKSSALNLTGHWVKDEDLAAFKNPNQSFVKDMDLSENQLTGSGLHYLSGLELRRLVLDYNPLKTIDGISTCTALEDLSLAGCELSEKTLAGIKPLTKLKRLNLAGTRLSDDF